MKYKTKVSSAEKERIKPTKKKRKLTEETFNQPINTVPSVEDLEALVNKAVQEADKLLNKPVALPKEQNESSN